MNANFSADRAMRGKHSPIWMPGTLVAIGLNSPRISAGALGLDLPHVLVRRSAAQEDIDECLVAGAGQILCGLGPKDIGQRERGGSEREGANPDEVPAANAIAEPYTTDRNVQHVELPRERGCCRWGPTPAKPERSTLGPIGKDTPVFGRSQYKGASNPPQTAEATMSAEVPAHVLDLLQSSILPQSATSSNSSTAARGRPATWMGGSRRVTRSSPMVGFATTATFRAGGPRGAATRTWASGGGSRSSPPSPDQGRRLPGSR